MSEEKYADYIQAVLKECPDANPSEVAEAFAKYEEEFYIPPQDAMRSVLRRFQKRHHASPYGRREPNATDEESRWSLRIDRDGPRCGN